MDVFKPILKTFWKFVEASDNKRIASQVPTTGIKNILDLDYFGDGAKAHLLDIYYPENAKEKLPVIIDIHGGGWVYGYKEINKYFCQKLAAKGFLVASINYRLAGDCYFKEQISDIFCALRWLSKNLADYPADLNNTFLCGDSAGGQFACCTVALNLDEEKRKEFSVEDTGIHFKAVGAISPAIDLLSPNFMMNVNLKSLLGDKPKDNPLYRYMDFANVATADLPPFYICTSDGDFLRSQAYKLKAILDGRNIENVFFDFTEKLGFKKLPHVFSVVNPYTDPARKQIKDMTEFFKSKM